LYTRFYSAQLLKTGQSLPNNHIRNRDPMKKTLKIAFTLIFFFPLSFMSKAAEQLYTDQPSVTPELADAGSYAVGVSTIAVENPDQLSAADFTSRETRKLVLEVWYPIDSAPTDGLGTSYLNQTRSGNKFEIAASAFRDAAPAKAENQFPLIVLSHGYTGYRTIMFYLGEHLASHGFVVAAIDHTDSTNAEIDFATAPGAGFPSTLLNRARDQQFVLDHFANKNSTLTKIVNSDSAAVIGYSMGGYGALNTVGACYSFSERVLGLFGFPKETIPAVTPLINSCTAGRDKADPRWKAMMAFAPWGGELDVHSKESMANIKVPALFVGGGEDDVSGYENGVKKLYEQTGSQDKYLMVYENARHNIAAHPAPTAAYGNDIDIGHHYEPAWDIEAINRVNRHMSLAFLSCYLKADQLGCDYLPQHQSVTQTRQADGKLTDSWPGFPERWGTGISFYRNKPVEAK